MSITNWPAPEQLEQRRLWLEIAHAQLAVVGSLKALIARTLGCDGELLVTFAMIAAPRQPELADEALVKSGDWQKQREYELATGRRLPYGMYRAV